MPLWHPECQCYSACRCCCVCAANPDMAEELSRNPTGDPNPSTGTIPPGGAELSASGDLTGSA